MLFLFVGGQAQDAGPHAVLDLVVQADLDIIQHAHLVEQADILEGTGHTGLADQFGVLAGDVLAVEDDVALGRLVDAGEHVKHGGLAGAVGADQTIEVAFLDGKVQLSNGLQAAESNTQVAYFQQCHVKPPPSCSSWVPCRPRPCGNGQSGACALRSSAGSG